ncbi:MAG: hypothetical protein WD398_08615 [Cyclobacteriaceae bacterium]
MRIACVIGCCLFCLGSSLPKSFVIQHKEIIVKGQTSLGGFECIYDNTLAGDTLFFERQVVENNSLDFFIPVADFGCGNFLLNSDFRKTLKAEEFPLCKVSVTHLFQGQNSIYGNIALDLAGKHLTLEKVVFNQEKGSLQGNVQLSFDQLDLQAPDRLGGLIKVEEMIELQINLFLEPT